MAAFAAVDISHGMHITKKRTFPTTIQKSLVEGPSSASASTGSQPGHVTYAKVADMFPKAVKTIGTPILSDTLFKNKLGPKRLWPGDARDVDDGTDVGPIENQQTQTLLEHYNVDVQLKLMMRRSFEGFAKKKRGEKTAIANKDINVVQATADFDKARTSNSMGVEATNIRSGILGRHKRAGEVHGEEVVGAPLLFAMIESGDYAVEEFRGAVEIGDFSLDSPEGVIGDGQSKREESSEGSESESESESEESSDVSESESENSDGSDSGKESGDSNENSSQRGSRKSCRKRVRANSVTVVDSDSETENIDGNESGKESEDSNENSSERGSRDTKRTRANSLTVVNDETTEVP
jgi:hypothetical protein